MYNMELIASGAQADVYLNNGMAVKLFKKNIPKRDLEYEINLQRMAYELGLPVPKVCDIVEIGNRYGILMEYIEGISVGKIALDNQNEMSAYLVKSIEIQITINKIVTSNFPPLKKILQNNINKITLLDNTVKLEILDKLNSIKFSNHLCHGDFHLMNLIKSQNKIIVIDWVNSNSGNIEADACRTYLLYKIFSEELSKIYIENYCKMTGVSPKDILAWLPILAASRLTEGIDKKEIELLMKIIKENV